MTRFNAAILLFLLGFGAAVVAVFESIGNVTMNTVVATIIVGWVLIMAGLIVGLWRRE